jgi:hypothetical protein
MLRAMPGKTHRTLDDVIGRAIAPAVARMTRMLTRSIDAIAAQRLDPGRKGVRPGSRRRRAARKAEMTRWAADRNARRVPKFVIEATGLDTKKKIVARYGEDAAFEKGKPLPPVKIGRAEGADAAKGAGGNPVKAKPPIIRKAAASH